MKNVFPLQLIELGARCSALIQEAQAGVKLKDVEIAILVKLHSVERAAHEESGMSVEILSELLGAERTQISRGLSKLTARGWVELADPTVRTSGYRLSNAGWAGSERVQSDIKMVAILLRKILLSKNIDFFSSKLEGILASMPRSYPVDKFEVERLRRVGRSRTGKAKAPKSN